MAESEKPGIPGNPVKPEALLKPAPEAEGPDVARKPEKVKESKEAALKKPQREVIDAEALRQERERIAKEKAKKKIEKRAEEEAEKTIEEAAEEAAKKIKVVKAKEEAPQAELAKDVPADPEFVQNNPHLVFVLAEVVSAPESRYRDKTWVSSRMTELRSLVTEENQDVVTGVLKEIVHKPGVSDLFDAWEIQEVLDPLTQEVLGYHWGQLLPRPPEERLFDEADPRFADLPKNVQRAIRRYNNTLATDEEAIDKHFLEGVRNEIAGSEDIPDDLREEILERLRVKRERVMRPQQLREEQQEERQRLMLEERARLMIRVEDIEEWALGYRPTEAFEFHPRAGFTLQDIETLKKGRDGEKEWFERFFSRAEVMVRSPLRLELPEYTKLDTFYDYLEWHYGVEDGGRQAIHYRMEIDRRSQYHIMRLRLLYQPGKPEYQIEALQFLKPDDLDYFASTRFANYTIPLYEDTVKNILSKRASDWLRLDETRETRLRRVAHLEARARDQRATKEEKLELQHLIIQEDKWGEGVMLWDTDIQGSFNRWKVLDERRYEAEQINFRQLTEEERSEFYREETTPQRREELKNTALGRLEEAERAEYERLKLNAEEESELKSEGRPLVDIIVQEDMIRHLEAQGLRLGEDFQEWEIRKAVSVASYFMNLTGHLPSIAASMARLPEGVKYKMKGPVFEDLLRVFNPEAMFFERFGFGGKLGETTVALFKEEYFKERGKALKITELPEWKRLEESKDPLVERNRKMLEFFEQELNIPFLELIRGGFLSIGGDFDASMWRAEVGLVDKVAEKFAQAGELTEHVGLGFQLGLAKGYAHAEAERWVDSEIRAGRIHSKNREKEIEKRTDVLAYEKKLAVTHKMSERLPGLILQFSPGLKNELLAQPEFQEINSDILQKMLKSSQLETSTSERFRSRAVNLATEDDFGAVCRKYLENLGVRETGQQQTYRLFLEKLQRRFKTERRISGRTTAEQWARHGFPITLTLADIDWSLGEFLGLSTAALDRRGRDIIAAFHTREAFSKILFNPSPVKNEEAIGNLLDFRKGVDGYLGTSPAEKMMTTMLRFYLHFNENKLRHLGWILPGLTSLLKNAPSSYAEMVSYSARFYGPFGNAYDETDIATIINSVRDAGGYTEHPELAGQIMKEFKATWDWRALSFIRKYWWVLILFTLKQAFEGEMKEQTV